MKEPLTRPRDRHEDFPEIWFAQSSRVSVNAEPSLSSLHPPEGWDLAVPVVGIVCVKSCMTRHGVMNLFLCYFAFLGETSFLVSLS